MHVIDVGKGDCILIQVGESAGLIDTGYADTSNDILAILRKQGVKRLEFVIITHYDRDHIGGIRAIAKEVAVDIVYLPGYKGADKNYRSLMSALSDLGLATKSATQEMCLGMGEASLTLIPSSVTYIANANGDEGNDNDLSLVASLTMGDDSYLFTGDLDKEGIAAFLRKAPGTFDILKVPRHGQKSSNTGELLEVIHPQVAIITDSRDDPAHKKVLKVLSEIGAKTYRTSIDGTVAVRSDGSGRYSISL